jgi:putative transposase
MFLNLPSLICRVLNVLCRSAKQRLRRWTKFDNRSLVLNLVLDLTRTKSELVLENALLRQQLIVLQRHVRRPALTWRDRALLNRFRPGFAEE